MPFILMIPVSIPSLVFLAFHSCLNASLPPAVAILFSLPLLIAVFEIKSAAQNRGARLRGILRTIRISLLLGGSIFFFIFILLLPENLYRGWLQLLETSKQKGMISFVFAFAAGLVSTIGCNALILSKGKVQAVISLFLLLDLVLIILYPGIYTFLIFLILLFMYPLENFQHIRIKLLYFLMILIPGLLFYFLPVADDSPSGSHFVAHLSGQLVRYIDRRFPEVPLYFQIPGYGTDYGKRGERGEKPFLSSQVLFYVEEGPVKYLRTDILVPGQEGWALTRAGDPRSLAAGIPEDALLLSVIHVESDLYTRIPGAWNSDYYSLDGEAFAIDRDKAILPQKPITRGDVIKLYSSPGFQAAPLPGESVFSFQERENIRTLALSLQGGTWQESLNNIRIWLSENCSYTLDTEGSEDLIKDFLFQSRKGYCVHFANAAAALAQVLDIPVRLGEGFLIAYPDDEELFYRDPRVAVSGYAAHVWPEIHVPGKGWVPWEVTPPYLDDDTGWQEYDPLTARQLQAMGRTSREQDNASSISVPSGSVGCSGKYIIPGLIFCLILFSVAIKRRMKIFFLLKVIDRTMTRRLFPLGTSGWLQWLKGMEQSGYLDKGEREYAEDVLLRELYSCHKPTPREMKKLHGLCRRLLWRSFFDRSRKES